MEGTLIRSFDIETKPLPDEVLREMLPDFDESKFQVTEFNPSSVKTGNIKDPAKKEAKIEEARKQHEAQMEDMGNAMERARQEHWESFKSSAALNPETGQILVVGFCTENDEFSYADGDEASILRSFWDIYREHEAQRSKRSYLVGVNIFNFDLPWLVIRSWINGVTVPRSAVELEGKWNNWSPVFLDFRRLWQLGNTSRTSSFDHIGRCLGTGGKCEGDHGATFAKLWDEDRPTALKYLKNDVRQPIQWLVRIGLSQSTAFNERIDF
mgnify:CR=1 FL=1